MAITATTGAKNNILDSGVDGTFPAGAILEIRSGAAPGASAAPTGTVLATITLPSSPWAAGASSVKAKANTWEDTSADAAGTAAHWRLKQAADGGGVSSTDKRLEGSVTITGGGGDMTLDNTNLAAAQDVVITAFNITLSA